MKNTQSKHTQAPWRVDDDGFISAGKGKTHLTIADPHCMKPEGRESEMEANARLIACAPELKHALILSVMELKQMHSQYCKDCKGGCPTLAYIQQGEDAILKAEGNNI